MKQIKSIGHRAQGTGRRAQSKAQRAESIGRRAQSKAQRAESIERRAQSLGQRALIFAGWSFMLCVFASLREMGQRAWSKEQRAESMEQRAESRPACRQAGSRELRAGSRNEVGFTILFAPLCLCGEQNNIKQHQTTSNNIEQYKPPRLPREGFNSGVCSGAAAITRKRSTNSSRRATLSGGCRLKYLTRPGRYGVPGTGACRHRDLRMEGLPM